MPASVDPPAPAVGDMAARRLEDSSRHYPRTDPKNCSIAFQ